MDLTPEVGSQGMDGEAMIPDDGDTVKTPAPKRKKKKKKIVAIDGDETDKTVKKKKKKKKKEPQVVPERRSLESDVLEFEHTERVSQLKEKIAARKKELEIEQQQKSPGAKKNGRFSTRDSRVSMALADALIMRSGDLKTLRRRSARRTGIITDVEEDTPSNKSTPPPPQTTMIEKEEGNSHFDKAIRWLTEPMNTDWTKKLFCANPISDESSSSSSPSEKRATSDDLEINKPLPNQRPSQYEELRNNDSPHESEGEHDDAEYSMEFISIPDLSSDEDEEDDFHDDDDESVLPYPQLQEQHTEWLPTAKNSLPLEASTKKNIVHDLILDENDEVASVTVRLYGEQQF